MAATAKPAEAIPLKLKDEAHSIFDVCEGDMDRAIPVLMDSVKRVPEWLDYILRLGCKAYLAPLNSSYSRILLDTDNKPHTAAALSSGPGRPQRALPDFITSNSVPTPTVSVPKAEKIQRNWLLSPRAARMVSQKKLEDVFFVKIQTSRGLVMLKDARGSDIAEARDIAIKNRDAWGSKASWLDAMYGRIVRDHDDLGSVRVVDALSGTWIKSMAKKFHVEWCAD